MISAAVVAGIGAAPASAAAGTCIRYSVEVIQAPYCGFGLYPLTQGHDVAGGMVVGYYSTCISFVDRAFVATPGQTLITLPMIPGTVGMQAEDVNAAGQIAGWAKTNANGYLAYVRSDGTTAVLGLPSTASGAKALGLSDLGVVVGESYDPSAPEAVVWLNHMPIRLPLPGSNSSARDVNETNQVVGWMGSSTGTQTDAFRYNLDSGELTNLGHLPDGTGAATAINECGDIVGYGIVEQPDRSTITRAIVWTGGGHAGAGAAARLQAE